MKSETLEDIKNKLMDIDGIIKTDDNDNVNKYYNLIGINPTDTIHRIQNELNRQQLIDDIYHHINNNKMIKDDVIKLMQAIEVLKK